MGINFNDKTKFKVVFLPVISLSEMKDFFYFFMTILFFWKNAKNCTPRIMLFLFMKFKNLIFRYLCFLTSKRKVKCTKK
ncbi:hypothetical protein KAOT1_04135 [Kordia algicida OT-1]|uniref:Uncharacterized protein n=1 Tax=Kordia algicida OT-1 TaxID=391587 RepID=A9ECT6_9FLAO|nr:hypothetical protein KAOT1_04135 [Kordia algicida OT-1]